MRYRSMIRSVMLALCAMPATSSYVLADIGGIGSPVVPSNGPPPIPGTDTPSPVQDSAAMADQKPAYDQDKEERKPLLVINYNQRNVYFDRALRQAVTATEKAKAGAAYDVISYVPSAGPQQQPGGNERISENASANLAAVVQGLMNLGVQAVRIHATTQSSDISNQKIEIFVQ